MTTPLFSFCKGTRIKINSVSVFFLERKASVRQPPNPPHWLKRSFGPCAQRQVAWMSHTWWGPRYGRTSHCSCPCTASGCKLILKHYSVLFCDEMPLWCKACQGSTPSAASGHTPYCTTTSPLFNHHLYPNDLRRPTSHLRPEPWHPEHPWLYSYNKLSKPNHCVLIPSILRRRDSPHSPDLFKTACPDIPYNKVKHQHQHQCLWEKGALTFSPTDKVWYLSSHPEFRLAGEDPCLVWPLWT